MNDVSSGPTRAYIAELVRFLDVDAGIADRQGLEGSSRSRRECAVTLAQVAEDRAELSAKIAEICKAIEGYYLALDQREHGGDAELRDVITLFGIDPVEDADWFKITPAQRIEVRRLLDSGWKVAEITDDHIALYGEVIGSTLIYRDGSMSHPF